MRAARRVATIPEAAPTPVNRPDHSRRLINGLSFIAGIQADKRTTNEPRNDALRVEATTDDLDQLPLGVLEAFRVSREVAEDPLGQHLLDQPIEGLGREERVESQDLKMPSACPCLTICAIPSNACRILSRWVRPNVLAARVTSTMITFIRSGS